MTFLKFVDAISPANITGGPFDGTCFYIGGDATRVWTHAEIAAIKTKYRLPIWVRSNPSAGVVQSDVANCAAALNAIGAPKGTLVALDSETSIDPAYVGGFVTGINHAGWRVIDYGSESDVHSNHNPDGYYWGADWTSQPHLHSGDQATQYVSLQNEDISLFLGTLPLWTTGAPPPPPVSVPTVPVLLQMPVLRLGVPPDAAGKPQAIHKLQSLIAETATAARLPLTVAGLAVDGTFGPQTDAGVRAIQGHFGLKVDGVVGHDTWVVLATK